MAFEYDGDANLILGKLTAEERAQIVQATQKLINDEQRHWQEEFGPFEFLSAGDLDRSELEARLEAVGDEYVWSDVSYDDGHVITPVEGCVFSVTGWAKIPAFRRGEEDFYISKKSSKSQDCGPVFSYFSISCDFCEGSGVLGEDECDVCLGSGEWQVDAS
jgi:hypothetical protein